MRFFINARAWQLLLFIVGIPMAGMLWYVVLFMPTAESTVLEIVMLAASLWMNAFLITWVLATVTGLHDEIRSLSLGGSLALFKVAIGFLYFVLLLFSLVVGLLSSINDLPDTILNLLNVLVLVGIADYFYIVAFAARTIVKAEQVKVKFSEYFKTFLQIMFFPIGIWFVQPRINKIALKR